jgi:purine-binding chemotaxis protein CheW
MSKNELNDATSYLSFRLGEEIFAINVSRVHKILELSNITEVPHAPDYMKGVINLRGNVLPVIDTRVKFGLSSVEKTKTTAILVVEIIISAEIVMVGMLVDAVHAVLKIEQSNLLPPPAIGNQYQSQFIANMARVKEKFFIVLNIDAVFSSAEHLDMAELAGVREQIAIENNQE